MCLSGYIGRVLYGHLGSADRSRKGAGQIILYKGVFWVIGNQVVSEKKLCDEFGNLISDENEGVQEGGLQEEVWSNNHKKIWSKLPRKVTQGKPFYYFPRGRVEIRRKRAVIFLNPCLCYEEMIEKIKAEFRLDNNEAIRDILVKADGSRHYRCDCEEEMMVEQNYALLEDDITDVTARRT